MKNTFIVFLLLLFSCSESPTENQNALITQNERVIAPNFSLQSIGHGPQTLSQYSGQIVYLYFIGYNCTLCIGHAPGTQTKIYDQYNSDNFQILGLDVWNGTFNQLTNFKNSTGVEYPLLQMASSVGSLYGSFNDYSILIDKNGRIAYRKSGVKISQLKETIDILLEEE